MLESGLRVEVSTCAIEVVDVMMESYQKTRFDASRKYMHTMHVPISNRLYTMALSYYEYPMSVSPFQGPTPLPTHASCIQYP